MTLSRRLSQLEHKAAMQKAAEPVVFDIYRQEYPGAELTFEQRIPPGTPMDYAGEVSKLIISYHVPPPELQPLAQPKGNDDE